MIKRKPPYPTPWCLLLRGRRTCSSAFLILSFYNPPIPNKVHLYLCLTSSKWNRIYCCLTTTNVKFSTLALVPSTLSYIPKGCLFYYITAYVYFYNMLKPLFFDPSALDSISKLPPIQADFKLCESRDHVSSFSFGQKCITVPSL